MPRRTLRSRHEDEIEEYCDYVDQLIYMVEQVNRNPRRFVTVDER